MNFDKYRLAKTTFELRQQHKILPPDSKFSYKNIIRREKKFTPLIVPKSLEEALPFKTKDKVFENKMMAIQQKESSGLTKVLLTDKEKKVRSF